MDNETIMGQGVNAAGGITKNFAAMQGNLDAIAKYLLYAIAALLPLWFLPTPVGIEFGREATFGILIIAAGIVWLLSVLTSGQLKFQHSVLLIHLDGIVLQVFYKQFLFLLKKSFWKSPKHHNNRAWLS